MKPETITALLALWERCEACKPTDLDFGAEWEWFDEDGNAHAMTTEEASALAADAIERWMLPRFRSVSVSCNAIPECPLWQIRLGAEGQTITRHGPDKLTALISAANAVLDAEGVKP